LGLSFRPVKRTVCLHVNPHSTPENIPSVLDLTISKLQEYYSQGLTSEDLVKIYLARIEEVNKGILNCVNEINPDAVEIAKALDKERLNGFSRG
jgi:amidase